MFYHGLSMKVACLVVPAFLVALARRDDPRLARRPIVIGGSPQEHGSVRACSGEAADDGVVPGMALRRALALCPDAVFLPYREADAEAEAQRLAALIEAQSPAVETIEPGHLHFDVEGLARLTGQDDASYLADLAFSVRAATGLPVRLAGAATVFAAHAAACCAPEGSAVVVPPGEERAFLSRLPVEVLPVPAEMHQRLRLFGLASLGEVARLPFSAMQAQFGRDGARAWHLAHGHDDEQVVPRRDEVRVVEALELPAPAVTWEPLVAATRDLLQRALNRREAQGHSLRRLDWELGLESGEVVARRFVFREPTADPARMLFVARAKIERLDLSAPGAWVRVTLSGLCSEYGHQGTFWQDGPRRRRELEDAIAQLTARAGEPQVYRIVEVQPWSRIPERQLALIAFDP
ncbi:MAG: DNA polymerase IV [Dehalococcoidia bacterium]